MKQTYSAIPLLLMAVAVQNANADIIALSDSASMEQDSGSVTINVLANDSSNTSTDPLFITSGSISDPAYGSVVRNSDNTLTYTPDANFVGTDYFTYQAEDTAGYGGTATVSVEVTPIIIAPPPPTQNINLSSLVTGARNKAVAGMLDQVCGSEAATAEISNGCNSIYAKINNEEVTNLDALMAEIAPDEALTQRQLLGENSRNKTSRMYHSMEQMRSGGSGASVSINNLTLPSGGGAGDGFGSPWTLLSALQVEDVERKYTLDEAGYDAKALSVMLGLGYRLGSNLNVGAALDWSNHNVDYVSKSGTMDADIYSVTGFVSWYKGPLSVDVQAGYSSGKSDAQRRFTFPTIAVANSTYDSSQINLSTQVEWTWQPGAWAVRPFLRVDYLDSNIDGFTETGSSIWLMQAGKQTQQQTNTSIGLNTSYTTSFSWGVMTPSLKVSMVNKDNLNNDPVAFQLVNANSPLGKFQLKTDTLDNQFYQWELSTVMVLANGLSTFISAETVSEYDNMRRHQISCGINKEF